jgi:hypothetical protein
MTKTCVAVLPRPAPERGLWRVICKLCGQTAFVAATGRLDDPKRVEMVCKRRSVAQRAGRGPVPS